MEKLEAVLLNNIFQDKLFTANFTLRFIDGLNVTGRFEPRGANLVEGVPLAILRVCND